MLLLLDEEDVTVPAVPGPDDIQLNPNHRAQGIARLIAQYVGKPRTETLIGIFLDQIQEAENALFELATERFANSAVGIQLDGIGDIVGQERQGLGDNDYRSLIRARIKANNSEGTAPDIIGVASAALNNPDPDEIHFDPKFPASFELTIANQLGFDEHILNGLIQDATLGGVRAFLMITLSPAANRFAFSAGQLDNVFDSDSGFDSGTTPGTGKGQFSRVLDFNTG